MDVRFDDHASFHRAAAGMVGGSALLGLGLHPVMHLAPLVGGIFGIAAGAAFAYGRPILRVGAAAVATVPLVAMAPTWPLLAVGAATLGFGMALGAFDGKGRALKGACLAMF